LYITRKRRNIMSLRSLLEAGKFTVTVEVGPLKGTDTHEIDEVAELLQGKVNAVNVTDQQSSVMRLGSLATCHLLKDKGHEPILQMTCRDRNRLAIQSDLLNAWVLGIENVLAITGDLPTLGDHPEAKLVYDLDSVQLLWVIQKLNEGYDIAGNELQGKPDFLAGAVVNPGAETEAAFELQLIKMEKKIGAGAKFFQTQAVFDVATFEKFVRRAEQYKAPILAGIIPLKSAGMARFMNNNISGISVPDEIIKKMAQTDDRAKTGVEIAAGTIKALRGMCQGVHIMAMGWEKRVPQILETAGV